MEHVVEWLRHWTQDLGVWGSIPAALVMCAKPWASFESTLPLSTQQWWVHDPWLDQQCWLRPCGCTVPGVQESTEHASMDIKLVPFSLLALFGLNITIPLISCPILVLLLIAITPSWCDEVQVSPSHFLSAGYFCTLSMGKHGNYGKNSDAIFSCRHLLILVLLCKKWVKKMYIYRGTCLSLLKTLTYLNMLLLLLLLLLLLQLLWLCVI